MIYIEEDISYIKTCQNVFDQLPDKIDLLVIDGGEGSGNIEFMKLYKRTKYFVLDDTKVLKNKENRQYILDHPNMFKIIYDDVILKGQMIAKNLKF